MWFARVKGILCSIVAEVKGILCSTVAEVKVVWLLRPAL